MLEEAPQQGVLAPAGMELSSMQGRRIHADTISCSLGRARHGPVQYEKFGSFFVISLCLSGGFGSDVHALTEQTGSVEVRLALLVPFWPSVVLSLLSPRIWDFGFSVEGLGFRV